MGINFIFIDGIYMYFILSIIRKLYISTISIIFLSILFKAPRTLSYKIGNTTEIPITKGALFLSNHIKANTTKIIVGTDWSIEFIGFIKFLKLLLI